MATEQDVDDVIIEDTESDEESAPLEGKVYQAFFGRDVYWYAFKSQMMPNFN